MKKARRLLNMAMKTSDGFSLSRVDANRHLFFPSTAQALQHRQIGQQQIQPAAMAAPQKEDYDGVLRLTPPKLRFESSPSCMACHLDFFPFFDSKVLCVNEAGGAMLCDPGASTVQIMPSLAGRLRSPAAFAVTRAEADNPARPEALYVLDGVWHGHSCQVSGTVVKMKSMHGSTICVSFHGFSCEGGSTNVQRCTYCFDTTGSSEWTKVGDWTLPFYSRSALHVPKLDAGLLFGLHLPFSGMHEHHFGAVDISCINNTTNRSSSAPVLQNKWVDVDPPPPEEWHLQRQSVAYLGAGRFCIHRGFDINEPCGYGTPSTR
ncbi:hypothetical protein ACQ4PT_002831 [Festuca glaucescens]